MNSYPEEDLQAFSIFLTINDIDHYRKDPHESILDFSDCKSR